MPRCAFLSTDNLEDFFVYDDLVKPYLNQLGWEVKDVSWHDKSVNYNQFDIIVVRSTWDYQAYSEEFLCALESIENSTARLENPFELMKWNFTKSYLKDLEQQGIKVLPTIWLECYSYNDVSKAFESFDTSEIIVKPLLSANADHTYRLTREQLISQQEDIKKELENRAIMVQSFEKSIIEQGEFSLFYFDHEFSHAINKRPANGDFRVQEEHGGSLQSVTPTTQMYIIAQKVLNALPTRALYARIDLLETANGLAIIEVELIEPSLYFNMDDGSPERFAKAIDGYFRLSGSK